MEDIIDGPCPINQPLRAKYKRCFAFPTMNERAPVIVTKIIDYMAREKDAIAHLYGEAAREDLKSVIGDLSKLKNELQTGKPLKEFTISESDIPQWNSDLKGKEQTYGSVTFYNVEWLFAECYLYRRIVETISLRKSLSSLDPFEAQKNKVLEDSLGPISHLFGYLVTNKYLDGPSSEGDASVLRKLMKNALWANRLDLCLSAGATDFHLNILDSIESWESLILVDDLEKAVPLILNASHPATIEFVVDNAGYEILSDLCLADYMVMKCGIEKIHFRVKRIPWFVSDVTRKDFDKTLSAVAGYSSEVCQTIGKRWQSYVDNGTWLIMEDQFWCLGLPYSSMPEVDNNLYEQLAKANLIIFKGDLNYRKLCQDMNWDPTVTFAKSLGAFHPGPLIALRTLKADTVAGLTEEKVELASELSENWMTSGEFAVIQFDCPEGR